MATPKELITYLLTLDQTEQIAYGLWNREDVHSAAENYMDENFEVSDEEADEILYNIHEGHDAEYGIIWECFHTELCNLNERRNKEFQDNCSIRVKIELMYLDFVNNYLTITCFAEDYNLDFYRAEQLLIIGNMINNRNQ